MCACVLCVCIYIFHVKLYIIVYYFFTPQFTIQLGIQKFNVISVDAEQQNHCSGVSTASVSSHSYLLTSAARDGRPRGAERFMAFVREGFKWSITNYSSVNAGLLAPIETKPSRWIYEGKTTTDNGACRITNHTNNACSLVGKEIVKWIILLLYWIIKSLIVSRVSELAVRWIKTLGNKVLKCCAVVRGACWCKAATH